MYLRASKYLIVNSECPMDIEHLRDYCIKKPHTTESFPFDEHTLVFKVAHKMFAVIGLERLPHSVNLKCLPELAIALRENFEAVTPAYHMNKKHWNTIVLNADMPHDELKKWVDSSYDLVVKGFSKKQQKRLGFIE